jgi:hypothetical protein
MAGREPRTRAFHRLERLRPKYKAFAGMPLFIMTSDA